MFTIARRNNFNEFVQKVEYEGQVVEQDPVTGRVEARRKNLEYRLAYEENYEEWEKDWEEYKKNIEKREEQRKWLIELYRKVSLPHIKNYIQRELIRIQLEEQEESENSTEKIFRNTRDINNLIQKISERDKEIKKKYSCEKCGKTFNTKQSVGQHTKTVHKKKRPPFLCPVCGKNMQNKDSMENHRRQAHGDEKPLPEECNQCYLRFGSKQALKDHRRSKHKIE